MSTALEDLYQEVIVDHYKRPRNRRDLPAANRKAEGDNPLCGDHVSVSLQVEDDRVKDIAFQGGGCAISTASASLMTEAVKGKTLSEAKALFGKVHRLVTGTPPESEDGAGLGKLAVFSGIRRFPARVKCAILAWHTLDAALDRRQDVVSTE